MPASHHSVIRGMIIVIDHDAEYENNTLTKGSAVKNEFDAVVIR